MAQNRTELSQNVSLTTESSLYLKKKNPQQQPRNFFQITSFQAHFVLFSLEIQLCEQKIERLLKSISLSTLLMHCFNASPKQCVYIFLHNWRTREQNNPSHQPIFMSGFYLEGLCMTKSELTHFAAINLAPQFSTYCGTFKMHYTKKDIDF